MKNRLIVIGAGGHAKVVVSTVIEAGMEIESIYDDDPGKWGKHVLDVPIRGPLSMINESECSSAVIAIGDNRTRRSIAERFGYLQWTPVVHPDAYVHSSVHLGGGTVVFAKAGIQPDSVVGEHCIINTGATIDHDCSLGDYTHIAPGVNLAGEVTLGSGVFCGIGTKVIGGISIRNWTIVGAGSVVVRDLPEYALAFGVPAKVVRQIDGDDDHGRGKEL
jgi:acetyltransferase EpsM